MAHDHCEGYGCKIHKDTLKAIWQKASSLVADTTLIAAVPGGANLSYDRMVASTSSNCPHLVSTPAKFTGQFKCDSKCPMFSTYKLCAHTIASAEVNGKLKEFSQWLIRQKCAPNYSKLALHGIPKGAGEKGGVPKNNRKRKQMTTNKTVVDRLSLDNRSTHCSIQEQHMDGGSCFMPAATIESVKNTWISPPPSSTYHMPTYGSMQPNMMYGVVPPPQIPLPSPWPSSNFIQSSWDPPPSHVISPYPFTLKILTTRIQICQSCRIPFHSTSTEPPYDLVVARKECRPYRGQGGKSKTPLTPSNSHYHISIHCVRTAEPRFLPHELVIPDEVHEHLTDVHKGFIFASLGLRM